MSVKKAAPKGGAKKAKPKPAGPGAIAAGGDPSTSAANAEASSSRVGDAPVESFTATGIDDALDMLTLVNAKADKASVGQDASKLEAHPEVSQEVYHQSFVTF